MELGSPHPAQELGARLPFVESFVETLVVMRHGGDQTAFARHLATVQYAFVSLDELRALLESMHQDEMANEEGCRSALEFLDGGYYTIGSINSYVELRQIASDTLQYRLTTPKIQSTARVSEGVPVALSRQASTDDAARTCWVGAIPDNTAVQQVEDTMAQFGKIASCSMRAKSGGGSYAFVVFESSSAAVTAQGGTVLLGGSQLKVKSVDHERLQARKGRRASIGASNAVWQAARG